MRVLITGFPPFPGRPTNPSQLVVEAIQRGELHLPELELIAEIVPCEYRGVEERFDQFLETLQPHVVLSLGVGRHADTLRFERCGVNLDSATIPDNTGELRTGTPICATGPESLWTQVDLDSLLAHLNAEQIPVEASDNAGRYVCNHLLYHAALRQQQTSAAFQFQFIHLPTIEDGFDLSVTLRGIQFTLEHLQTKATEQNLKPPSLQ